MTFGGPRNRYFRVANRTEWREYFDEWLEVDSKLDDTFGVGKEDTFRPETNKAAPETKKAAPKRKKDGKKARNKAGKKKK